MARDISNSGLSWSGHYLVNPFADVDDGSLVDLGESPGLRHYFQKHGQRLKGRHCARSRARNWYRTIDRFWPSLTTKPKLVIPDIQPGGVIGYDEGLYYPHHNVYWITSGSWDLRVLQKILQSDMVTEQLRALSVSMRGKLALSGAESPPHPHSASVTQAGDAASRVRLLQHPTFMPDPNRRGRRG